MSLVAITGDHPRHKYLVSKLWEAGFLSGWILEIRKPFIPEVPENLHENIRKLFQLHFQRRESAENNFFGDNFDLSVVPTLTVSETELNGKDTQYFLRKLNPRLVISYGCHKISQEIISSSTATFWNCHGGLSPQYRGVTTHFWPSYFLEPQMTGMTLHETTKDLDGGAIVHQTAGSMVSGDGLHDLAGRTVKEFVDILPSVFCRVLSEAKIPSGKKQKDIGKLWIESDWRPEHLVPIYEHCQDRIVDMALSGEIKGSDPKLISIFSDTLIANTQNDQQ